MISFVEQKSQKCIGITSFAVLFEYSQNVIDAIKEIGDCIWHKKEKYWEAPINKLAELVDKLTYLDDIDIKLLEDEKAISVNDFLSKDAWRSDPFDYQLDGIKWLVENKNGLLTDPPGLGKTLQILYAAEEIRKREGITHCLILCGINSLKLNWEDEVHKHTNSDCVVIGKRINKKGNIVYSSIKERAIQLYEPIKEFFVIMNVEMLADNMIIDAIRDSKNKFEMICFDECHRAKNPTSLRGKNLLKLRQVGDRHIGMTGTLLVNSPIDAYVPLKFIGKENANYSTFKQYYIVYEQQFGHMQPIGFRNLPQLKEEIESCSLRRSKDLLNLPPKVIIPEIIEMSAAQSKFYEDLSNGVIEEADRVDIKTTSLLGLVVRLRQASTCPSVLTSNESIDSCKIERACELVDEIISNGDKVIIFSEFKEPLYRLKELLKEYNPAICTGDQKPDEIMKMKDAFQTTDSIKVLLATSQKMGTGFTLTAASYAIFLDSDWTPALETQAEDRVWRIGANKTVFIYKLIAKNTIDERVQVLLKKKQGISDYMIDDKQTEDEDLRYLLGLKGV